MNGRPKLLGTAAAFLAQSTLGHALEVSRSLEISAPPAAVWAIIGDFCSIELWHPQVERCTLSENDATDGVTLPVRGVVTTESAGTIVEAETARNEGGMSYSSILLGGPLPVRNYSSTIAVTAKAERAVVTWRATFEADGVSDSDAVAEIAGIYERGLAGIAREAAK
jgi:carbon monoxide dehydrogenase subunit G